jgi:predicted nucleotidyltransferase/uncharacterized protein (UPF0332 family)
VKFDLPVRENPNIPKYSKEDLDTARDFSRKLYREFGNFLKSVIIFGSVAKKEETKKSDIDLLIVVDDITMRMTPEVVEAYRVITEKVIGETSKKLHVTSMKFTAFWEYIRSGDPVAINVLRDGIALIDSGFFDPLQVLLYQGRIRPTPESIWTYMARAPRTLHNSKWHMAQATIDLYWAIVDSAHAVLMYLGYIPPSPEHIGELLREKMVKQKLLASKYAKTADDFYDIMKRITHREIKEITGKQFDNYFKEAEDFVNTMENFIKKSEKKEGKNGV